MQVSLSEVAVKLILIYIYIYIYIYEPDTFRVYITTVCCLQYIMESKM